MQPNETSSVTPPAKKSHALRYVLALVLLVVVIGGIAWVRQNLPSLRKDTPPPPNGGGNPAAKVLEFPRWIAQWDNQAAASNGDDPLAKENYPPKEFEFGRDGHYDFPFKNVSGKDVDVIYFVTSCDCTSIQVCAVPMAQWTKLADQQKQKPGDPLTYDSEPAWQDLQNDRQYSAGPKKLTVKPDEGGVVRVRWAVKKTAGQSLRVMPDVVFHEVGQTLRHRQRLAVPVAVDAAVRFQPPRVIAGVLAPGAKPVKREFDAWSSTREKFDLKLSTAPASPFFEIETRPLTAKECADLQSNLKTENSAPRVLSGHHVTVTIYESKDKKQLDQGPFLQKLAVELDGFPERELPGPEIVGRVYGDITVGGADDQGKVQFKLFEAGEAASKSVELLADAKVTLEPFEVEPKWLEVKVTRNKEQPDAKKHRWTLWVGVPENTPGVRSFEETDHVTLRIVGPPERFLRIAIEGHVRGR